MNDDLLAQHHADLDRRVAALLLKADEGDAPDLALEWGRFERELLEHFALEEREVLPRFACDQPEEAAALRQEHEALRRDLLTLGIRADLHFLRAEAVRAFATDLRAHAAHEERALYPWARTHVDHGTWATIAERLRGAGLAVAHELGDMGSRAI